MSETFTASNGWKLLEDWNGNLTLIDNRGEDCLGGTYLDDDDIAAFREYFTQGMIEAPECPEGFEPIEGHPGYYAQPLGMAAHDGYARSVMIARPGLVLSATAENDGMSPIAREWFHKHPEKPVSPWDGAQLGDVWVVTLRDQPPLACQVTVSENMLPILDGADHRPAIFPTDRRVISARRIWPQEVAE